jgi:hypothetical protein
LRVHDFAVATRPHRPTLALGLEGGLSYLAQNLDDGERRASWSPFFGPAAVVEQMVGHRMFLRGDLGVPVYLLRVAAAAGPETRLRPALSMSLGAGGWF